MATDEVSSPVIPAERPSVDAHASQIVFFCSMNQACIMWQAILDKKLQVSTGVSKKLAGLVQKAVSLGFGGSEKLQMSFRLNASSVGFLRINVRIAMDVIQGELFIYGIGAEKS